MILSGGNSPYIYDADSEQTGSNQTTTQIGVKL